jgi:U3 small nucleolar RNA-associated protein 15
MLCLWDSRSSDTSRPVFSVNHEHPIEDLMFHGNGNLLISSGGNEIKVWDIFSGGKMIHNMNNHQKTITSICMDSTKSRLISGGLDGHLKVYNMSNFAVTHGFKYDAPIISVAVSPDNMNIMVGTTNGMLSRRHRDVKLLMQSKVKAIPPEHLPGGSKRHFERGQNLKSGGPLNPNAVTVSDMQSLVQRKQRLRPYDLALKKFRYHDALDASLLSRNPNVVVTVLEELVNRQGLERALSGRDEVTLEPILSFLARYTTNPRYAPLLVDVCSIVFEMYKSVLGQSEAIDELFTRLGRQVKLEVGFQKQLLQLLGTMDTIINVASSAAASPSSTPAVV